MSRSLEARLERALSKGDEEVLRIVEGALLREKYDFIRHYTLPAMIDNTYAPAFGWSAEFRRKNDYLEFVDSLMGEDWAYNTLVKYVRENIEDYTTPDEIEEAEGYYDNGVTGLAEEIVSKLSLKEVIDILSSDLHSYVKSHRDEVEQWIEKNFDYGTIVYEIEATLEEMSTEGMIDIVEAHGSLTDLEEALNRFEEKEEK